MNSYLIVLLGSGLGGMLRHAANVFVPRLVGLSFPYHTLVVNIVGCFAMGLIAAYFGFKADLAQPWRLFFTTGVLGGFTTFSAFSLDAALLYERGDIAGLTLYVLASVGASIGALFIGMYVVRTLG